MDGLALGLGLGLALLALSLTLAPTLTQVLDRRVGMSGYLPGHVLKNGIASELRSR